MASRQSFELGELLTNAKGGKYLPLKAADGVVPAWSSPAWLRILWHPAAFGDADARRVNVCFEPDESVEQHFKVVEKELASKLVAKSGRDPKVFGRSLSPAELEARLQSCLKTSQRGTPFLKAKLNWDRVRFWDTEGYPLQEPGDLAGRSARVRLELRQVWVMNPQCGLLLEVTDLQLQESEPAKVECPFG